MGTGADFYLGIGPTAKYLGSIRYDGHIGGKVTRRVCEADSRLEFRAAVLALAKDQNAGWTPKWRWKWPTSATTDYSYHYTSKDGVLVACMGRGYRTLAYNKWWEAQMAAAELAKAAGVEPTWPPEMFDDLPEVEFPIMREEERLQ